MRSAFSSNLISSSASESIEEVLKMIKFSFDVSRDNSFNVTSDVLASKNHTFASELV